MTTTDRYIHSLLTANPIREPLMRRIIQSLQLPCGSCGLDAGCGIGLQSLLLADAIGPDGSITGLDLLPDLLTRGAELAAEQGFAGRVNFQEGDLAALPFPPNSFDWAWSADCAGYPAGDLGPVLKELKRVVRPGGWIILLGWTSQMVLPGYPVLEARLNATSSSYLPHIKGRPAEQQFARSWSQLQNAGLQNTQARTFLGEVQAPLDAGERAALVDLFEMLWSKPGEGLAEPDWEEFQRLRRPGSGEFILDQPGYTAFFTYTLFQGKVGE